MTTPAPNLANTTPAADADLRRRSSFSTWRAASADSTQFAGAPVTSTRNLGDSAPVGGKVSLEQVIKRAQAWIDHKVPYSSNGAGGPFGW